MSNQYQFNDWSAWAGPLQEVQEIQKKSTEAVSREYISFCTDSAGSSLKLMQTLPRITSPEDLMHTSLKIMSQQGEKFLEFSQNVFNIYQDAMKENIDWTESKMNTAMKNTSVKTKKSEAV